MMNMPRVQKSTRVVSADMTAAWIDVVAFRGGGVRRGSSEAWTS